jgi:hypothetical protein
VEVPGEETYVNVSIVFVPLIVCVQTRPLPEAQRYIVVVAVVVDVEVDEVDEEVVEEEVVDVVEICVVVVDVVVGTPVCSEVTVTVPTCAIEFWAPYCIQSLPEKDVPTLVDVTGQVKEKLTTCSGLRVTLAMGVNTGAVPVTEQLRPVTVMTLPSSPMPTVRLLPIRTGFLQKNGAPERHDAGSAGENTLIWKRSPIIAATTRMAQP